MVGNKPLKGIQWKKILNLFVLPGIWAGTLGCTLGDVVRPGDGDATLLLAEDNPLSVASLSIQSRYPTLSAANAASNPKFIDSHPAGANHAELAGYGVTMIAHNGIEPIAFESVLNSSFDVDDPNLLFFNKVSGSSSNWQIIGAGYATN